MPANAVGQLAALLVYHAAQHGHVLAQLAVDQATVDVPEHLGRLELGQGAVAPGLVEQARGHELEQHGDEG
ncbi:hypothetical protein D3C81_2122230 [compost metagenome]